MLPHGHCPYLIAMSGNEYNGTLVPFVMRSSDQTLSSHSTIETITHSIRGNEYYSKLALEQCP
jgi:hypothetical protein